MRGKYKVGILSLGCPRNLVDSENILGRLNLKGHPIVDIDKADAAIVNTCAFIEDAKEESVGAILDLIDLKKKGKLKKIIVYGCLAQRYKDKLQKELPEVDAFVGKTSLNHSIARFSLTPKHYAYVKICEGCVNNCSYCIIPKIKGRFTSLDIDSILSRIEILDKDKVSEVNIVGQDITGYGMDLYDKTRLPELIKRITRISRNIGWLRLLYLYPSRISDELLEIIKDEPKVCKYIDLPLQHVNDRILKLMNRPVTKESILKIIEKIRKKIPDIAIRSSIIVGFPSETENDFRELMDFIRTVKFERLGAFMYSREEGTAAYNLKGQIPSKIKQERFNALMLEQQRISEDVNRRFMGRVLDVLIDEKVEDFYPVRGRTPKVSEDGCLRQPVSNGVYLGRSQYDAPEVDGTIYVDSERALNAGDFVKVEITDTLEYDLVGRALP